jgi:hypothetical protein
VGRVYARKDASNHLQFGLAKASEGATYSSNSYSLKTTYLLVLKYRIGSSTADDSVSLFVIDGTVPGSEPAAPTLGPLAPVSTDPASIAAAALRQGGSTTGAALKIDEIKIDTSWNNSPLGVDLAFFTALAEPGAITLRWTTASELECYQWQIERSPDISTGYQILAIIPARGNDSGQNDYSWTDSSPEPGQIYYYRLKVLGIAGDAETYGPVKASAEPAITGRKYLSAVSCSPNPFAGSVTFSYLLNRPGRVELSVYNIQGHLVKSLESAYRPAGRNSLKWNGLKDNGQACASGIYFYRLASGGEISRGKLILLK